MNAIILHPDYYTLHHHSQTLKGQLLKLQEQHDDLVFHVCKGLQASYMLHFGELEYKAWDLFCQYSRIVREIELVQAKINREEPVNQKSINRQLDIEFAEYTEKLKKQSEEIQSAIDYTQKTSLSIEETLELKALYHELVKLTHPDLHPGASQQLTHYFQQIVKAFEAADLQVMQMLRLLVKEINPLETHTTTLSDDLKEEIKLLQMSISRLEASLQAVRDSFPYNQLNLLENPAAIQTYKNELTEKIANYALLVEKYKIKLKEIQSGTLWMIS
ncbi:MAG: hypothetical protein VB108_03990 [Anaerolineaceae bacterium]|nr:hypothetical protein [Anaerolineaceae bacterium]